MAGEKTRSGHFKLCAMQEVSKRVILQAVRREESQHPCSHCSSLRQTYEVPIVALNSPPFGAS
jgi:hypothetical protein